MGNRDGGEGSGCQAMIPGDRACDSWEWATCGEGVRRRK